MAGGQAWRQVQFGSVPVFSSRRGPQYNLCCSAIDLETTAGSRPNTPVTSVFMVVGRVFHRQPGMWRIVAVARGPSSAVCRTYRVA